MYMKHMIVVLAVIVLIAGCGSAPDDQAPDQGQAQEPETQPPAPEPEPTTPETEPVAPADDDEVVAGEEEESGDGSGVDGGEGLGDDVDPSDSELMGAEIEIIGATFNPNELSVKSGSKVTFTAKNAKALLVISGGKSGPIDNGLSLDIGESKSVTLQEAEQVRVFNIFSKSNMFIEVEE